MQHCISRWVLFVSSMFLAVSAYALDFNMPYGVSTISHEIYNLHMAAFYICCAIGAITFSVLIFSLFKYRKSKGVKAAHFHEHLGVEIFWTVIPTLILIALAVPATIVLAHIHNTEESALTIKVTGYQWKWKYEYLDQGISFFSNMSTSQEQIHNKAPKSDWFLLEVDHPMVVPINTKVKILVTADDVIHAWWVPEIGVKQDAVPGFINENWFYITKPGTYRGQCGELCGVNHAFMPVVVKAVTPAEFSKWVIENQPGLTKNQTFPPLAQEVLLKNGKEQYEKSCAMCHQNTGLGLPPSFPALKGDKVTTGPVKTNIDRVIHGVPRTAMQAFGDQLDNNALAAVITYTRSAWGNDVINKNKKQPTMVQPQEIQKARE